MAVSAVLLVTAVVWAVSLIRSVRLRAFVYSLPLPMTLALVATGIRVDGAQVLGVVGLNLFFLTVTVLHHRLGWHILVADLLGIVGYLVIGAVLFWLPPVPFAAALAGTLVGWVGTMLVLRRRRPATRPDDGPRAGSPPLVKLLLVGCGAIPTVLLGDLLRQLVVTFPYSGVLVVVEARRDLPEFSRHFARNSVALVAFLTGFFLLQERSRPVALAGAWAVFGLVALALHAPGWASRRRARVNRSDGCDGSSHRGGPAADRTAPRPAGAGRRRRGGVRTGHPPERR